MGNLKSFLRDMQEKWAEQTALSKQNQGNFVQIPDGRYVATLTKAEVTESKASNRPQVAWGYTIREGDLEGETIRDYDGLDREMSFYYLARKLSLFGIDPEQVNLVHLEKVLEDLVARKPTVRLRLRTKDEFQNAYVERVIPDYEDNEGWEETATNSDASPFVEDDEEDEEDAGVELFPGMNVQFVRQGKPLTGTVTVVDEDAGLATVKVGTKAYPVPFDSLSIVEEGLEAE